jgi:Ca-activated chloride channel homolog
MISLVLAATLNWPVQYNAGVTAYRSNDFSSAATTFEQATAAKDRELQRRAFYNLGNTSFRLGEADPSKAQPLWERALKNYETALALDPKDEDAKFNHEFVKKKLEELKKQQEQQQQQNQKNQDQEKKDQDQKRDQQNKDQDQKQQQQSQQDQQKQQQKDEQQPKPEQSEQKQPPQEPKEQQPQQAQTGNLDKQQAKALLDNLREDERNWNFFPEVQMKDLKDSGEPAKDW